MICFAFCYECGQYDACYCCLRHVSVFSESPDDGSKNLYVPYTRGSEYRFIISTGTSTHTTTNYTHIKLTTLSKWSQRNYSRDHTHFTSLIILLYHPITSIMRYVILIFLIRCASFKNNVIYIFQEHNKLLKQFPSWISNSKIIQIQFIQKIKIGFN